METIEELKKRIEELETKIAGLKERAEKQEKMASLGLLSAGIAHEVQNPLNFVMNFSKMSASLIDDLTDILDEVKDDLSDDDQADIEEITADLKGNLEKINEHGERALSVIRGILLQSRGKTGEFLPTDLSQLVHEYIWLSYHALRASDKSFNASIHEEYPESMPKLLVIPQDISRAVLNVMNNAFYTVKEKAGKSGPDYVPTVSVKLGYDCPDGKNAQISIAIEDNGMGMPSEVKEKVFDNFFTTKPAGQGTGLGMGIIRHLIIDNHQGSIGLESEEGKGTVLTMEFPAKTVK